MFMDIKYKVIAAVSFFVLLVSTEAMGGGVPQSRPFGKSYYQDRIFDPHLLSISLSPSFSTLRFSYQGVGSKGALGVSANFEYTYLLSKKWSVTTGLGYNLFNSSISLHDVSEISPILTEKNGNRYTVTQQLNTIEKQQVAFLTIPLKANYRLELTDFISLKVTVGAAYALPISENVKMTSGSIKRSAYFPDLNVSITDLPSQNFGRYNGFIKPSSKKQFKGTIMALAGVAGVYDLNEQLSVSGGIQFMFGGNIKNISEDSFSANSYSGATAASSVKSINPFMAGIGIGVSYRFVDVKVGKKKGVAKIGGNEVPMQREAEAVKVNKIDEPVSVEPKMESKTEPAIPSVEFKVEKSDTLVTPVASKTSEELAMASVILFVQQFNSSEKEHFGLGVNDLNASMLSDLDSLAANLKLCSIRIMLVGHTCNSGSEALNEELGLARAQKAKNYLVSLGVDPNRIDVESMGSRNPKYPNDTEANRAKNRRVEIMVK